MLKIEQAFLKDFIDQDFKLPIGHENAGFKPAAGTAHVLLTSFPNDETARDLAHSNITDGFFQFQLRYPENAGAILAKQKRDAIFAKYPIGRTLSYGTPSQSAQITGRHGMPARNDGGWFVLTCAIFYRAFTPR